jgi:hypothetical protein
MLVWVAMERIDQVVVVAGGTERREVVVIVHAVAVLSRAVARAVGSSRIEVKMV